MKDHSEFNDRLSAFALAEIEGDEAAELKAHISQCDICSSELARLESALELFAQPDFEMPPAPYFGSLVPTIRARIEKPEKPGLFASFGFRLTGALSLAAAVVFVIFWVGSSDSVTDELNFTLLDFEVYSDAALAEYQPIDFLGKVFGQDDLTDLEKALDDELGSILSSFEAAELDTDPLDALTDAEMENLFTALEAETFF